MKFPDHLYLEPADCWDDDPDEDPVDEDRVYDHWKEQKIMDDLEREENRRE